MAQKRLKTQEELEESDDYVEVEPVHHKRSDGKSYKDIYSFREVHFEFGPDVVFPDDSLTRVDGDRLFYQYSDKVPVLVTKEKVFGRSEDPVKELENQAYFVLSLLDGSGYVSGWGR